MSERIYDLSGEVDALHTRTRELFVMEFIWRRSRTLGLIALLLTVAGTAIAVARPHSVTNPGLSSEWQCSRTLFVVTCSHSPA
jgi:hypothetical protein